MIDKFSIFFFNPDQNVEVETMRVIHVFVDIKSDDGTTFKNEIQKNYAHM